ncbi:MAG: tetratricopeptide repeat protein, partial [Halioglobus sp.]|nr:tetratricopeptide repeat protein [Halioglobus sp.]
SIAWDARPANEGGQRWYHLYPDEAIDHSDPLHWTGPYQNWNSRCAECHSTDVHKRYDRASDTYNTQFKEVNVRCEACHGPGEDHVRLAQDRALDTARNSGLTTDLAARGNWIFRGGAPIAQRTEPLAGRSQIDACARCHARRGNFGDYHHGADFLQTHRPSLPLEPLYHPDGQILDEVYVYGSFLQSRMHLAGVVCSDCHEPHSARVRASDNGVCAQCHRPDAFDVAEHHHHKPGSAGALCANCHMPETTYMGVDPRRDHSMRIPRPDFSLVMGTPNACNQCHTGEDAQWSLDALRDWGVTFADTSTHPARAFARLTAGDTRAVPTLIALAADSTAAPIWRAAALERAGGTGSRNALELAARELRNPDSLVRTSAVHALEGMPLQQRFGLVAPLARDDVTAVRMAVAESLAAVPIDQLGEREAQLLRTVFEEYTAMLEMHSDMPGVLMQFGLFHASQGDAPRAEQFYRDALARNPLLLAAYLNLADLMRAQARDNEAREILQDALSVAPDAGAVLHALGLLETRSGASDKALDYLRRAAALETTGTRHRFVYAIALHDLGQPRAAISALQALLRAVPGQEDALLALANYHVELGETTDAARYAEQLTRNAPDNSAYRQLYERLRAESAAPRSTE